MERLLKATVDGLSFFPAYVPSGARYTRSLARAFLGDLWEASWTLLEASWGPLAYLVAILGCVAFILGRLGGVLGHLAVLEAILAVCDYIGRHLEISWSSLGLEKSRQPPLEDFFG